MWSYVTKLHVLFFIKALLSDFFLYKKLLQYHLVRCSSLNNSSQLQALNFFHIELHLRRFGVLDLSLIMPGLLITSNKRLFQIAVMVGGWGKSPQWNLKFYWGNFFRGWKKHEEEWFWQFEPLSKLQTAFCEYWASIKIKINMM